MSAIALTKLVHCALSSPPLVSSVSCSVDVQAREDPGFTGLVGFPTDPLDQRTFNALHSTSGLQLPLATSNSNPKTIYIYTYRSLAPVAVS